MRDPTDRDGQIAYLASLRNIGPARAERLVDAHGEDVLAAIAADPEAAFAALPGVSETQAADAAESWHDSRVIRDLHVQLAPHGLAHLAASIHTHFGDQAMKVLRDDPYRLTEAAGVGFARADRIALAGGVAPDSERRLQAAAAYVLGEAEQRGNVYLPVDELTRATEELLRLPVGPGGARRGARPRARRRPRLPRADPRRRARRGGDAGRAAPPLRPSSSTSRPSCRRRRRPAQSS